MSTYQGTHRAERHGGHRPDAEAPRQDDDFYAWLAPYAPTADDAGPDDGTTGPKAHEAGVSEPGDHARRVAGQGVFESRSPAPGGYERRGSEAGGYGSRGSEAGGYGSPSGETRDSELRYTEPPRYFESRYFEPCQPEPRNSEPRYAEPRQSEPRRFESGHSEPPRCEPGYFEPRHSEHRRFEPPVSEYGAPGRGAPGRGGPVPGTEFRPAPGSSGRGGRVPPAEFGPPPAAFGRGGPVPPAGFGPAPGTSGRGAPVPPSGFGPAPSAFGRDIPGHGHGPGFGPAPDATGPASPAGYGGGSYGPPPEPYGSRTRASRGYGPAAPFPPPRRGDSGDGSYGAYTHPPYDPSSAPTVPRDALSRQNAATLPDPLVFPGNGPVTGAAAGPVTSPTADTVPSVRLPPADTVPSVRLPMADSGPSARHAGRHAARHRRRAPARSGPENVRGLVPKALVVAFLAGGSCAFVAQDKAVQLSVDGTPRTLHTFADDIGELLEDEGVRIGPHDVVEPVPGGTLSHGDEVVVRRGRLLTLTLDGERRREWITAGTVREALRELEVRARGAYLSAPRGTPVPRGGLTLEVRTERTLTVLADGAEHTVRTNAATVGEVVGEAGVELRGDDTTSLAADSFPRDGGTVRVLRITGRTETREKPIPFRTVRRTDPGLFRGTEVVVQPGTRGVKRVTYSLRTVDGVEQKPEKLRTETVRKAAPRIVRVGTRPLDVPGADGLNWAAVARCESGGRPWAVDPSGERGGLYQLDTPTWQRLGGIGHPQHAPAAEQTYRAKKLYVRRGASPWPECGRKLHE